MTFKHAMKTLLPGPVWRYARERKDTLVDFIRNGGRLEGLLGYCGFKVKYTNGMTIVARVRKEGIFERKLCEALADVLLSYPNPILLDIGSNIGLISLYELSRIPSATVHAFDPGSQQSRLLSETVALNSLETRLHVHQIALGEHDGEVPYFIHEGKESSKDGFRNTGRGGTAWESSVSSKRLDTWWDENGRPQVNAIKIDTEGAELFVLRGGERCITTMAPAIFLEIEPRNLAAYPYGPADLFDWFTSHGYGLASLEGIPVRDEGALTAHLASGEDTFVATPASSR